MGTKVLAMYPDTTVFYKGTVSQPSVSYEVGEHLPLHEKVVAVIIPTIVTENKCMVII